jgi:multicomponent Na+:H+ antiporter subunit B
MDIDPISARTRLSIFILAALCVLAAVLRVSLAMPAFGHHPLPYGDAINALAPIQRHVTNMVSAVNFDYRGFDTLGEEFMLLCAVTGATVLLRGGRGEGLGGRPGTVDDRPVLPRSDAVVLMTRLASPVTLVFGGYVVLHAMTTPGGGFQGGVIIASGLLLIFLGERYSGWRRMVRFTVVDAVEGAGAALFALCGFASMAVGQPYLANVLPYGQMRDFLSGGLMIPVNLGVAFAVAGGFAVLFLEFLEETRAEQPEDDA